MCGGEGWRRDCGGWHTNLWGGGLRKQWLSANAERPCAAAGPDGRRLYTTHRRVERRRSDAAIGQVAGHTLRANSWFHGRAGCGDQLGICVHGEGGGARAAVG